MLRQRLAQLNSGLGAQKYVGSRNHEANEMLIACSPYLPPVAGPSTPNQAWLQPQYLPAQSATYHEVPSTARIVEVSQGSPQVSKQCSLL